MSGDSGGAGSFSAVIVVSSSAAAPARVFAVGRAALLVRLAMMVSSAIAAAISAAIPAAIPWVQPLYRRQKEIISGACHATAEYGGSGYARRTGNIARNRGGT